MFFIFKIEALNEQEEKEKNTTKKKKKIGEK